MKSELQAYRNMIQRCTNQNHPRFRFHGGRGITVCDRWMQGFDAFIADMGPKPTDKHTLERIDNNKGYSPDNCMWATMDKQNQNRRPHRRSPFGISGIHFDKKAKRLRVSIGYKGGQLTVGYADSLFDAACLRKAAELKLWQTEA